MAWGASLAPSPSAAVATASFLSTKFLTAFLLSSAPSSSTSAAFVSASSATTRSVPPAAGGAPTAVFSFNRSLSVSTSVEQLRNPSRRNFVSRYRKESPSFSRGYPQQQRLAAMASNDAAASIPKVEKSEAEWRTILSPDQFRILRQKGTEWANTGKYDKFYEDGVYECAGCGTPLYKSVQKFKSGCGWPAFYEGLPGAITETPDADGRRVEITCTACGGHLGHNFRGEGFPTPTNERHCVNSISLKFTPAKK